MATKRFIPKKEKGYESINRNMLQDNEKLSLEARGLLAYMLSMPDSYEFHKTQLQKYFAKNKRKSVERIWNELLEESYIIGVKFRNGESYQYDYHFKDTRFTDSDFEELKSDYAEVDDFKIVQPIDLEERRRKDKISREKREQLKIKQAIEKAQSSGISPDVRNGQLINLIPTNLLLKYLMSIQYRYQILLRRNLLEILYLLRKYLMKKTKHLN
ncbi:hypothetical protein RyT2_29550 [Pseudolactococcus yaeyamensis]